MKKITLYQLVTVLMTLLTITVNVLANALPLNGQETGEISDRFAIYFVPAGYVFSVWGLIYLGLIAFAAYQVLPAQRENQMLRNISPAYWIGSLANAAWIFLWHYEHFAPTLIAMLSLLATLIYINREISKADSGLSRNQRWFVKLPFSIYLGWISVATIANISQVLFASGWQGWGIDAAAWAVIMIAVATALGLIMLWRENDRAFVLVLVWAFVGIALNRSGSALVEVSAWAGAAVAALATVFIPLRKRGVQTRG